MINDPTNIDTDSPQLPLDLLGQAYAFFARGDLAGAYLLAKEYWLSNQTDARPIKLLSNILEEHDKKELSLKLKVLAENTDKIESNAQILFDAGYQFIEERELELAAMLLKRCADIVPTEPIVRYELGFALMQSRHFSEAIPHFEYLMKEETNFDTSLNLVVCYSLTRNLSAANNLFNKIQELAKSKEEKIELAIRHTVLRRLERFDASHIMTVRDWVFSLYGSVLLSQATPYDLKGKPRPEATDYEGIASTLLVLRGLVAELGKEFDVIEFYSPVSRPMAEAFARLLDLPIESYRGPDHRDRCLLMMAWASDIIGPHKSFIERPSNRSIFAYGLTALSPLPLTPDIIGCLASECSMPWTEELDAISNTGKRKSNSLKTHPLNKVQIKATDQILDKVSDLESQPAIIQQIEELSKYYLSRQEMLVLCNPSEFPSRPEYTAEIPLL